MKRKFMYWWLRTRDAIPITFPWNTRRRAKIERLALLNVHEQLFGYLSKREFEERTILRSWFERFKSSTLRQMFF